MWQSQAVAGALRLGALVPSELGTVCWAKPGVAAIASPPARNVRRLMRMCRLPGRSWPPLGRLYSKVRHWNARPASGCLTVRAWVPHSALPLDLNHDLAPEQRRIPPRRFPGAVGRHDSRRAAGLESTRHVGFGAR